MALIDPRFRENGLRYLAQCGLATVAVLVTLLVLDVFSEGVIVASLGASAFIAFTMPHTRSSGPRFMVGGYVMGLVAGVAMHGLSRMVGGLDLGPWTLSSTSLFGAAAVGLAIFLMVLTDTEHPPAAGLALGVVLAGWDVWALVVPMVGVVVLSVARRVLRPVLINLI